MPKNVVSEQRIAEAVLIVNDRNQLSDTMLNRLGFNLDLNDLILITSKSHLMNC